MLRGRIRSKQNRARSVEQAITEALEPRVLFSIPLPNIPANNFLVTNYGAVGNGTTNNATDIQAALTAAKNAGGGTVEIPAASEPYECGPITVYSNTNLQIDSGATLQMLAYNTYPGAPYTGSTANFITYDDDTNVELSGSGLIDGQGSAWWTAYNANNSVNRPRLVEIENCNTGLFENVSTTNAPTFNYAFGGTSNITINGLTINAPSTSPNTDGIDPSGSNYLIENCFISTGDDNIAVKPQSTFCSNITITGCTFGTGHGLSVGGETNDGLNGMTVTNCTFNGTTSGIRLKADRGNGGLVENLSYSNLTMTNVEYPININSYYPNTIPPNSDYTDTAQAVNSTTPIWENITFSNVTSNTTSGMSNYNSSQCAIVWGLPEEPISGVSFINVNITARLGVDLDHTRNISFDSATKFITGSGPDLIGDNATTTPLDDVSTLAGFTDQDIGSPGVAGASLYDPTPMTWTNKGGGAGITGTSDQFNFASTSLLGDGNLVADVTSAAPQSGVMIRGSTAGTSAFAATLLTSSSGVEFIWRPANGATVQSIVISGKSAPQYVEISRQGSNFAGYYSSNGTTWTQIGTAAQAVTMGTSALAGLAVSSANNSTTSSATFTNVGLTLAQVSSLVYVQEPSNTVSGQAIAPPIVVEAEDAYGTPISNVPIALAVHTGPSTNLSGTLSLTTGTSGTVSFSNTALTVTGTYTLVATSGSLSSGASTPFVVSFANVTWTGAGDGVNWSNAANWSNDLVPNQYENVTVPAGVSTVTVGAGTFQVLSVNSASPINIQGKLFLFGNSTFADGLTIGAGGQLDLTNTTLMIDYGATDPIGTIQSYIDSGYNNGAWNGPGIMSSSVSTANEIGEVYGVGYSDGADGVVSALSSGQIEIMPTLGGDAQLAGTVSFYDFQLVLSNFGKSGQSWDQGDFDYSGTVDFYDFQAVLSNFGQNASLAAQARANPVIGSSPLPSSSSNDATLADGNAGLDLQTFGDAGSVL